jgi:hypothetical protein
MRWRTEIPAREGENVKLPGRRFIGADRIFDRTASARQKHMKSDLSRLPAWGAYLLFWTAVVAAVACSAIAIAIILD